MGNYLIRDSLSDFLDAIERELRNNPQISREKLVNQILEQLDVREYNERYNGSCNTPGILSGLSSFCMLFFGKLAMAAAGVMKEEKNESL